MSCTGIQVKIDLKGPEGNAFAILNKVLKEMEKGGVSKECINRYRREALLGSYENLLKVTREFVDLEVVYK